MLVRGAGGKLLMGPGGKLAGSKGCCCEQCAGCCLPTGTDSNGIPCSLLCYPAGPQLYLDLTVTGGTTGFGNLSFRNIPFNTDSRASPGFCPNLGAVRNPGIDGGPTFIGNLIPFAIDETLWDCSASRAAIVACGPDPGEDCGWGCFFGVTCETKDGKFTGKYTVSWTYTYDDFFTYDYTPPDVFSPTSIVKCFSRDNAVDMTFVFTSPPTAVGGVDPATVGPCLIALEETKTFTFRIHS